MKSRLTDRAMLLLLTLVLLPVAAMAADAKVIVTVFNDAGAPMPDVQVFLGNVRAMDATVALKTNKKGIAEFKKVTEGVYRLVTRAQGFEPILIDYFPVKAGEQKTFDLKFVPGDWLKKFYFEDPTGALDQQMNQLLQEATQLIQKNEFEPAQEKLKQALEINPTNPNARQLVALSLMNQQKWDEGRQALEQAIENLKALKMAANDPTPFDQAIAQFEKVIASIPAMKVQLAADKALKEGRNEEAATQLQELVRLTPDDPIAFYNLALAQAKLRHFDDAKKSIDRAAQLKPDDKAIQDLKRLLDANEKQIIAQQAQQTATEADTLVKQGKYEDAIAKYQKSLPDAPPEGQANIWLSLGRTYAKMGQPDKMVDAYKKALELSKDKVPVSKELADYYFSKDMLSEGVAGLVDAYKGGPDPLDQTLYTLGTDYSKRNKMKAARALFEEALKVNPNHAEAHYELGMIYFYGTGTEDSKDVKQAKQMLTEYTRLSKDENRLGMTKAVLIVIEKQIPTPAAKAPAKKK